MSIPLTSNPEPFSSDPILIKSPFLMGKAIDQVRLSLDKHPKNKVGNTDAIYQQNLSNGNVALINEIDPKLNYVIGSNVEDKSEDLISLDKLDYQVPAEVLNKTSKVKHKEGLPLSFLQIENETDGIEWYRVHFPKIPDELLPIIARYHWGTPITKKSVKLEKKRLEKKIQAKGLVVEHKNISVKFD
mgnify:CR=1 FL=1